MSEFGLEVVQDDGSTLRDHLMAVWRSKGKLPKQLEVQEPPELVAHLWRYFAELHKERQSNGFNTGRITATTIKDWCQVYCVELELWEVKAIKKMDEAWIKIQEETKKNG